MKIMFICTGNICRSAMAHALMEKKIQDNQLEDIQIYSAGIFAETGDKATYSAIEVMEEYGVDLTKHKATHISQANVEQMDLVLCATTSHKYSVLQMYGNLKGKVYTMKQYANINKDEQDLDIKDPWGYDIEIYRFCAAEIDRCLEELIQKIK